MTEARPKLFSSLPFILTPNVSSSSIPTINYDSSRKSPFTVFPSIRETNYGESLGLRAKFQEKVGSSPGYDPSGSPDLIHWGKYFGTTSNTYNQNDFTKQTASESGSGYQKHDDGYIGFYHYANGISFDYLQEDIEEYILQLIGIEVVDDKYQFKKSELASERYVHSKREMVITYCSYNIFNKSDFRARFVVHMNSSLKSTPVQIDKSYQVIPNPSGSAPGSHRKTLLYNHHTIKQLPLSYWDELKASHLIRLFHQVDNPASQLTGLVNYSNFIDSKAKLKHSVRLLAKFLNKGHLCGSNLSYGLPTICGNKGDQSKKTNHYRNNLVNTLIRLVQLDLSGAVNQYAIDEIRAIYPNCDFDYVILKLLKVQNNTNVEKQYLEVIHRHLLTNSMYTTQLGLILIEQVKFLITKEAYDQALLIAKKCVQILPLDFECWFNLTLCYILIKDYENALLMMNSLPVIINPKQDFADLDEISGTKDLFMSTFVHRLNNVNEETISDKSFKSYFPLPQVPVENYSSSRTRNKDVKISGEDMIYEGSIKKMWCDTPLFTPYLRHPINGNYFYQSPLINCSAREISSVDPQLIKLTGPSSVKGLFTSQSSGSLGFSILDFNRKSTWGRCYDLLSYFVATVGWDTIVGLKEKVFTTDLKTSDGEFVVNNGQENSPKPSVYCEKWLEQLFLIIYEDLRTIMVISSNDKQQQHSALEWEMLGLLGWGVKYNLEESISSLITSVMGTSVEGGFDYFGTVQLLEIYDEFILSETTGSRIELFNDDYDLKFFSNKLILKLSSNYFEPFVQTLETKYLSLEFVMLHLMKLISWDLRWYNYTPNYLVTKILTKLIIKYDLIFVSTGFRVVFENNKKSVKAPKKKFNSMNFFSYLSGTSKTKLEENFEFVDEDTIFDYIERLIRWIESLREE
ncbi:uncharacterized protein CANTADRAFT_47218 [Suhomyces tanzawaensis NRRL Y-17324]|uniref:Chaps-domain-containing protein n=1 Tax=Suhomyces tanzawaensis NRRL Y-17324 TaxID=984487 RepID=A0A1E4SM65_9ASCO|nr:uncharacterized protein CANTADRAFT_47218 [Suhomyces tanzawaensis NRRL Y-17324]ODV80603.1 hypothetical protein CANTADRAFT_47218 [Suhomyces tanzawaensis NRRL Y-17324]